MTVCTSLLLPTGRSTRLLAWPARLQGSKAESLQCCRTACRCPLLPCRCRDKDPREDLKTLARMYCTTLEMQMRDKAR